MDNLPLVSICCLVYNHERYLRDCLDGFFFQKTDFHYEIIIHDDASTDKSADIIKEYMTKFPNVITPIFQTENQYSKGKEIIANILFPQAKGKYIAYCEGDDYWIDPYKLQKQVEYMEHHPECSLTCHASQELYGNGKLVKRIPYSTDINMHFETIFNEWGDIPSASIVFNNKLYHRETHLRFAEGCPVGDGPLQIYLATIGHVHYFCNTMSIYRVNSIGSWSERNRCNKEHLKQHQYKMISWAQRLYSILPSEKHQLIDMLILNKKFTLLMLDYNLPSILASSQYKQLYKKLSMKSKISLFGHWLYQTTKKRR